jgi:hypothetical protein
MSPKEKGNGHTPDKRSGVDRRIALDKPNRDPERRSGGPRRKNDRAADKPIKR